MIRAKVHEARRAAVRPIRRRIRSPFPQGARPRLLLHCCHHKTGTSWFNSVLTAVSDHYGLRFQNLRHGPLEPSTDVALRHDSQVDLDAMPELLGSHMIRDPRDVVVSGYNYHLWTTEPWAHEPRDAYGGRSYQEHLRALSPEEGLAAEMHHAMPVIDEMLRWDYGDPRFVELSYEEAIADPVPVYRRVFAHYGFTPEGVETATAIADRFSFRNLTGRRLGETQERSHLRSGEPGQWREVFTPANRDLFKELAGEALIRLGYEDDHDW